jgi:DNA-binding phage protein
MLSKQGNPEIKSLMTLLNAMGLALTVKAQKQVYA